jgi:hypothetical protein
MKNVFEVDSNTNPDFHELISQVINKSITKEISLSSLSQDGLMKKIEEGKLTLNDMENDMKISQSKFFHCYTEGTKEIIIQIHCDKIAVFTD